MYIADVDRDRSHSTPKPPPLESNFGDSSEPLFSMYTKVAEEEDKKMVERWQKDADGILIFVSLCLGIHTVSCMNWNIIDWSILRFCCYPPFCDRPGPEAKQSGYLCVLSWEYL